MAKNGTVDYAIRYKEFCAECDCRVNSSVLKRVSANPHQPLTVLDLTDNYVGPKGFAPIVKLIGACPTIERLGLRGNGVDNSCVSTLCQVLEPHLGVTSVDLADNPITLEGGKLLMRLLDVNRRIVFLDVQGTELFESLVERINMSVRRNGGEACGNVQLVPSARPQSAPYVSARIHRSPQVVAITSVASRQRSDADNISAAPTATADQVSSPKAQNRRPPSAPNVAPLRPRPPPPALASLQASRLSSQQQEELREVYRRRAEAYAEIEKSTVTKAAESARRELDMLEAADLRASKARLTPKKDGDKKLPSKVEVTPSFEEQPQRDGEPNAPAPTDSRRPTTTTPPAIRRLTAAPNPIEVKKVDDEDEEEEEDRSGHSQDQKSPTAETSEAAVPQSSSTIGNAASQPLAITAEMHFKASFQLGCKHYAKSEYDAAFIAWNECLDIASAEKNREWMAVMAQNLQRLSYEKLLSECTKHMADGDLDNAASSLQMAGEVAARARNAAWCSEVARRQKTVLHVRVQRLHSAATKLFDDCCTYKEEPLSDETVFEDGPHTEEFVNEWSRMLLLKEAVERWTEAVNLSSQAGGAGRTLNEVIRNSLDQVSQYLLQRYFIQDPDSMTEEHLSTLRTAAFTEGEKRRLLRLWKDTYSQAKSLQHPVLNAASQAIIGQLHLGVYELRQALNCFAQLKQFAHEVNDGALAACAETYAGLTLCQRSDYSLAEKHLRTASALWQELQKFDFRPDPPDAVRKKTEKKTWASLQFIVLMSTKTWRLLVQAAVSTHRYREALELLECSKLHTYCDLLEDKLLHNFNPTPTIDHITAVANSVANGPLVYYHTAFLFDWDLGTLAYRTEEHIYIWVVPAEGEIKFVLVETTQDLKIPSLRRVLRDLRSALVVDPIPDSAGEMYLSYPELHWKHPLRVLYDMLMSRIIDFIHAHTGYADQALVTIVPDSYLWLVPFSALLDPDGSYVVENMAIQHTFSAMHLAYFALLGKRAQEAAPDRMIAVPQPATAAASVRPPFEFDVRRSVTECSKITDLLRGEYGQNDVAGFVDVLRNAKILHVATPVASLIEEDGTSGGGICLATSVDHLGVMPSADIAVCDCFAQLVCMSNSNVSGSIDDCSRDPVFSVFRSIFAAGASAVVGGLWCTPDMTPADFFVELYTSLKRERNPAKAMATAIRRIIRSDALRYSPRHWCGYIFLGVPPTR